MTSSDIKNLQFLWFNGHHIFLILNLLKLKKLKIVKSWNSSISTFTRPKSVSMARVQSWFSNLSDFFMAYHFSNVCFFIPRDRKNVLEIFPWFFFLLQTLHIATRWQLVANYNKSQMTWFLQTFVKKFIHHMYKNLE